MTLATLALAGTLGLFSQPSALAAPKGAAAGSWKQVAWFWGIGTVEALACPSTSVCVAGGNAAVGLRTTDGGKRWAGEMLPYGVTELVAIACPTTSVCEAVARDSTVANEVLLRTTDGGKSWVVEKLPRGLQGDQSGSVTAAQFTSIACSSQSVCVAVGTYGDSAGEVPVAVRTTDGGARWVRKHLPGNGTVNAVSCPSRSTCEAVFRANGPGQAEVLRTTNGGANWSRKILLTGNVGLLAVSCTSNLTCMVGGYNSSATVALRTTNGGRSWTTETLQNDYEDIDSLVCRSSLVCEATSTSAAFRTTDGGKKWASTTLPNGDGEIEVVACPSTTTCVAAGNSDGLPSDPSGGTGVVLRSTNYVSKWAVGELLPVGLASLNAVACRSSACQAGDNGYATAVRTTNSGASWTYEALPGYYFGAIACPSSSTCVLVNDEYTARTTNGGRSWVGATLPTGAGDVGAIACPSTSVCEAVGQDSGLALRTTNGGRTWVSRSFPKIGSFYDFSCPSTSVCEAIGENTRTGYETALRTTNGGRSWAFQNIPDGLGGISAIACPSTSLCEAVGETSGSTVITLGAGASSNNPVAVAIRTTDGGKRWTIKTLSSTPNESVYTVVCPTKSTCEAIGEISEEAPTPYRFFAFRTTDGGTSWRSRSLPSGMTAISALACASASNCEAVGYRQGGAAILRFH